jgi:hypothetical protein
MSQRHYLGSAHTLSERVRVYRTEKALEVDRLESYEIRRSRVLFDEVLLVTLHRKLGGALPWLLLTLAVVMGFSAALASSVPELSRSLAGVAGGLVLTGAGLFFTPLWVVTVFGRRTRARLQFRLREKKARAAFAQICQAVDEAQRTLAGSSQAQETGPPEPPS